MENDKIKLHVRVKLEKKLLTKKYGLHPTHSMHRLRQKAFDISG